MFNLEKFSTASIKNFFAHQSSKTKTSVQSVLSKLSPDIATICQIDKFRFLIRAPFREGGRRQKPVIGDIAESEKFQVGLGQMSRQTFGRHLDEGSVDGQQLMLSNFLFLRHSRRG